jgi:hypothetical protein
MTNFASGSTGKVACQVFGIVGGPVSGPMSIGAPKVMIDPKRWLMSSSVI